MSDSVLLCLLVSPLFFSSFFFCFFLFFAVLFLFVLFYLVLFILSSLTSFIIEMGTYEQVSNFSTLNNKRQQVYSSFKFYELSKQPNHQKKLPNFGTSKYLLGKMLKMVTYQTVTGEDSIHSTGISYHYVIVHDTYNH
jgi:hypothetical protein